MRRDFLFLFLFIFPFFLPPFLSFCRQPSIFMFFFFLGTSTTLRTSNVNKNIKEEINNLSGELVVC